MKAMNPADHERARQLMAQSTIEGCSASDAAWLRTHLAGCEACAREASALASAVASLRALSVKAPPGLAYRTRLAVRRQLAHSAPEQPAGVLLWAAVVLSMASMMVTVPLAWWAFEWLGGSLQLPDTVWQAGFLASWFLPATIAAVLLAWWRLAGGSSLVSGQAY
jgi:hypothetical protein